MVKAFTVLVADVSKFFFLGGGESTLEWRKRVFSGILHPVMCRLEAFVEPSVYSRALSGCPGTSLNASLFSNGMFLRSQALLMWVQWKVLFLSVVDETFVADNERFLHCACGVNGIFHHSRSWFGGRCNLFCDVSRSFAVFYPGRHSLRWGVAVTACLLLPWL